MKEVKNGWSSGVNAPRRSSWELLGAVYKTKRWVEYRQKGNHEASCSNKGVFPLSVYRYGAFPYYGLFPKAGSFSDFRGSQIQLL